MNKYTLKAAVEYVDYGTMERSTLALVKETGEDQDNAGGLLKQMIDEFYESHQHHEILKIEIVDIDIWPF